MKALKIAAIVLVGYVGIVVLFESAIGVLQPGDDSTLIITTFDPDGGAHDRVVSRLESGGQLYVAANHWPRAWFERAQQTPEVEVTFGGEKQRYRAVRIAGEEHDRVDADNALPLPFRFLTGFPPRYFLRLEPQAAG